MVAGLDLVDHGDGVVGVADDGLAGLVERQLLAAQHLVHVDEALRRQKKLETGVDPHHVTVGELGIASRGLTGDVVHTATPTRGEISAVPPGHVLAEPQMQSAQRGIHTAETIQVLHVLVVRPLAPRQDVGACARGIVVGELVGAVGLVDLAADKAIPVLETVEIVQRALEIEDMPCVLGEHHNEGGVPHEDAPVEGGVNKGGHEAG